jgi:hypothetical protein
VQITATCQRSVEPCRASLAADTPNASQQALPASRTFHINYRFEGNALQLDPASQDDKREYDACAGR